MLGGMSLQNTLDTEGSILVKGECREEYRKYINQLILLFKNKVSEGSLIESELIRKEIEEALENTNIKVSLSELLEAELEVCCIELYVKLRRKVRQNLHILKLKSKLSKLTEKEKTYIIYKVNSLVLFDNTFPLFEDSYEHPDHQALQCWK